MRGIFVLGITAAALVGAGLLAYNWYSEQNIRLSEKPNAGGTEWVAQPQASTIGIRVALPFSVISKAINEAVPTEFAAEGNGEDVCQEAWGDWPWPARGRYRLWRVCVGTHYRFSASRPGEVALGADGQLVHAELPVTITGQGGFRGDLGRITGVDWKNFRASAVVRADLGLGLSAEWCPTVSANVDYNWTETPRVEIVSRVWVDVSGLVNDKIRSSLNDLPAKLAAALPCQLVRDAVSPYWKAYDIPIEVPGTTPLHIAIQPIGAKTSGLIVEASGVRIAVGLLANVSLSGDSLASVPQTPLPNLEAMPDAPGELNLLLPLNLPYSRLEEAVSSAIVGKEFPFEVGGGEASLTPNNVEIYPGETGLVLGLGFSARLPGKIFDVTGTVYASARPRLDEAGTHIGVAEFSYARVLDNDLWSLLSVVLEGPLREAAEATNLDLNPLVAAAVEELQSTLSDPAQTGGVEFEVTQPLVRVEEIVAGASNLTIVVRARASVDATINEFKL